MNSETVGPLPQYISHKVVRAALVMAIGVNYLRVQAPEGDRVIEVGEDWIANRITEREGDEMGVYMEYEDGYTSWQPEAPFRAGYSPVVTKESGGQA